MKHSSLKDNTQVSN